MTTDTWFDQCKQLANDLKSIRPIPAIGAREKFDFPGVYIFSEKAGQVIYVGESHDIPSRLDRHFGRLRRDGTPMPVGLRSTPHRTVHAKGLAWPWDYLCNQEVRAIEIDDPHMRKHVERALILELNPIANP
jgi:hypothetical protein